MDDRKHRQPGYRDSGAARDLRSRRPGRSGVGPGPALPPSRAVSRCAQCGTLLLPLSDPACACPKCGLALRSYRQCTHFDPGRRFECTQLIPERLPDKDARNDCGWFALRTTVERDTSAAAMSAGAPSASGPPRPADARRAFDDLFKK